MNSLQNHATTGYYGRTALRVACYYILFAACWILFSDQLAAWLFPSPAHLSRIQTVKGWLFVIVTGGLLYLYLRHCLEKTQQIEQAAKKTVDQQFQQMATLFDSFNAIIYLADIETHELLYVNPYARRVFGDQWQGKHCHTYLQKYSAGPCDFCTNRQLIENGVDGPALIWEFQNTHNHRWYECLDKVILWGGNRLARLEIALDITERKELEQTKDELLSTISHEMRTPLTAISGFSELLLEEPDLSPQVRHHLRIIERETETLEQLIDTFLELRRIKTDRSRVGYQVLHVDALLAGARQNCRECSAVHKISVVKGSGLTVYGNPQELTRVIAQLVDNACRFSPRGAKITLEALREGDKVLIRVEDDGPGIPVEEQEKIFTPFYRLDTGNARRTRGTGLGLSLAQEVIELHGGKIRVQSLPGSGSCFVILLPEHQDEARAFPSSALTG